MTASRRFLFAMWDGGGNVPPAIGLVRRLVARGHAVHVLGDPTLAGEARRAGAGHTAWRAAPHRRTDHPEDVAFRDYDLANPLALLRRFVDSFVGGPAPLWAGETLAALEASRADALVADIYLFAALIAGEKLGIPTAAYCPNIWVLPTPDVPPFGPGLAPARGPLGRARDALLRAVSRRTYARATPHLNAVRRGYGLPAIGAPHEQALRADEVYVLTSPRFDFTSPALPPNVRYGGPVLDEPSGCHPWRSPWLPGDARPLVLVGFSSTYQRQAGVLRRVVEALSSLPVRGLVTLGPVSPEQVPGSREVIVVPSAPHAEVLREASLLVTHCGHGTTMRALLAGVPLVCVPMGRDQNDTAARVVHHGAGVRLSPGARPSRIRDAIARVLADPSYRRNARRLGAAIASGEGCVDVVGALERLASLTRPRGGDRAGAGGASTGIAARWED